ncbi:hypothetical protein HNY73_019109 [Argiope bruennichi]|uniref:Peptidase aspartic putative domain-containing protein n=1 Tax=Argiope bruennichi TaxID=94029 RepID=A0A8T0EFT2_ARGBR|nr:hypothetical protein HNY73_019109 [Argiope bruennichi]
MRMAAESPYLSERRGQRQEADLSDVVNPPVKYDVCCLEFKDRKEKRANQEIPKEDLHTEEKPDAFEICGKTCSHLTLSPEPNSSFVHTDVKVQETVIQHDETLANWSKSSNVFLQALSILVRGETTKHKARAIIDSGSQWSYILKETVEEMNYKAKWKEYLQHSLFGGSNTSTCQYDVYMIYLSSVSEEYNCHFEVLGQEVICDSVLSRKQGSHFKELRDYNIHLAEDLEGPMEILIGDDVAGKLITGNHLQLKNGITAIETKLGWMVIGHANSENTSLLITSMLTTNACITDLWTVESFGITDPSGKKTAVELQEAARQYFLDIVKIENDSDASMYVYAAVAVLGVETTQQEQVAPEVQQKQVTLEMQQKQVTPEIQQKQVTLEMQQEQVTPEVQQEIATHEVSQTREHTPENKPHSFLPVQFQSCCVKKLGQCCDCNICALIRRVAAESSHLSKREGQQQESD